MATRDLINLLKDSGIAAPTTHDFLSYVPGADSTGATDMQDYILTDWSWATSDYSSSTNYAYDTVLHFAFNFVSGDRYMNIKRLFADITVGVDVPSDPGSYGTVVIVDGGYNYNPWGISAQHGIAVRLRGALTKRTIASWTAGFDAVDGASADPDPAVEIQYYVQYVPTFNAASATYHTFPIRFTYPAANFNDGLSYSPGNVTVMGTVGFNSYDIEWYSDSSYTTLVATATTRLEFPVSSSGTNYGIYYVRWREENGAWTYTSIHWWDRRAYGSDPN